MTKPTTRAKRYVRCGSPDCDCGAPLSGFGERQLNRCRRQFREHCIQRHGSGLDDTGRICWFDLQALTLTLLDD